VNKSDSYFECTVTFKIRTAGQINALSEVAKGRE